MAVANAGHPASVACLLIRQAGEDLACAWDGGESIDDITRSWSEHIGNSHGIQDASKALLQNPGAVLNTRELNRASQLMGAVDDAPRVGQLFRGMEISQTELARLKGMVGKEFSLPISSFTTDRTVANEFARLGLDDVPIIVNVSNTSALDISASVIPEYAYQAEHLVYGNFRVVDVRWGGQPPNWNLILGAP